MQRQSRHNRLVLDTPDQASCDVFRPCPPGWTPAPQPPFPPQPDPDSDEPVVFGFVAVDLPDGVGIDSNEPEGGAPFPPGVTGADQLGAATYSDDGGVAGWIGAAFDGAADFDGGTATFYDAAGTVLGSGPISGTLTPIDSLTAGPIAMPALVVGQTYYVRLAKP